MAPVDPTILLSLIPFLWSIIIASPEMCPLTSAPVTSMKRMLGLDIILATIFSIPRFSVLCGPVMQAPAANCAAPLTCEPHVVTATGFSGLPDSYSPFTTGHPAAGLTLFAILNSSHPQYFSDLQ